MNFEEHAAKPLLAAAGIPVPDGELVSTPEAAAEVAGRFGAVVVKAQVPTGKRGKAGGIRAADGAEHAHEAAEAILGMRIAGHLVERLLVERRVAIAQEHYASVLNDPVSRGPLVLFAVAGGMDIEEVARSYPEGLRRAEVDIRTGFDREHAQLMLSGLDLGAGGDQLPDILARLYAAYRELDAELLEVNPLALTAAGELLALDCKYVLDDSSVSRQPELAARGVPERLTELERRGQALGLKYIELDGDIGVLANGAGLTMTTMDVVQHYGGRPANFLEIGGEAYTLAKPALELVLDNPKVKSLCVNFCGAFARTDVMIEGFLDAWLSLSPTLPVYFSVHGTGQEEAHAMLRERLDVTPFETMDEAVQASIAAAHQAGA